MAHFKRVTSVPPSPSQTNAVIMGRKTWESIPPKFRPLDNRLNVILSRSSYTCDNEDVLVCSSLKEAMEKLNKMQNTGNVYVIGGGQVYKESLESGLVQKVIRKSTTEVIGCIAGPACEASPRRTSPHVPRLVPRTS